MYLLNKNRFLKGTPELRKKYDAFYRTDVDKWNLVKFTVIQFFTFIPRWTVVWCVMAGWLGFNMCLTMGMKQNQRMGGIRQLLFRKSVDLGHFLFFPFNAVFKIEANQTKVCYKKYLGEDWVPTFGEAGISVSNHYSWLDIPIILYVSFPSFVAKKETLNVPVIGKGS